MSAHVVAELHSKLSSQRRDGALLLRHLVAESSDGAFRREHGRWLSGLMHMLRAEGELAPARAAGLLTLAALVERSAGFAQEQRAMAGALQRIVPVQVRALPSLARGQAGIVHAMMDVMDAAGSSLKPFGPKLEAAVLPLLAHDDAELRAAASSLLARVPFLCMGSASGFADAWLQLVARVLGSLDALAAAVVGGYDGGGLTFGFDGMPALELQLPTNASIDDELAGGADAGGGSGGGGTALAVLGHSGEGGGSGGDERPDAGALAAALLVAVEAGGNQPAPVPSPSALAAAELRVGCRAQRLVGSLCACLCAALQPAPARSGRLCGASNPGASVLPVPVPVRALVQLARRALSAGAGPRAPLPPEAAFPEAAARCVLPALQAGMADVLVALCATAGSAALAHCAEIGGALSAPLSAAALGARAPARPAAPASGGPRGEGEWAWQACPLLHAASHVALRLGSSAHAPLVAPALEFCVDVLAGALHAEARGAASQPAAGAAGADAPGSGGFEEVPIGGGGRRGGGGGKYKRKRGAADSAPVSRAGDAARAACRPALVSELRAAPLCALLHAALSALPALLAVGGALQPPASRLALEQLLAALLGLVNSPHALAGSAASAGAGGGGGARKPGAAGAENGGAVAGADSTALEAMRGRGALAGGGRVGSWRQSARVHCALLEALGGSFCTAYALQPPMLAACLPLLAASRRAADSHVAACAARVLCAAEVFLHPRLAPSATPRLAVEAWAAAAADVREACAAAAAEGVRLAPPPTAADGGAVHAAGAALAQVQAGMGAPQDSRPPPEGEVPQLEGGGALVAAAPHAEAAPQPAGADADAGQQLGGSFSPAVPARAGSAELLAPGAGAPAHPARPQGAPREAEPAANAAAEPAAAQVAARAAEAAEQNRALSLAQQETAGAVWLGDASGAGVEMRDGEDDDDVDEGLVRAGGWDDSDDDLAAIPPIIFAPPDA